MGIYPRAFPAMNGKGHLLVVFASLSRLYKRVNRLDAGQVNKERKQRPKVFETLSVGLAIDRNRKKNKSSATLDVGSLRWFSLNFRNY